MDVFFGYGTDNHWEGKISAPGISYGDLYHNVILQFFMYGGEGGIVLLVGDGEARVG
jgi:hypothetical protein